MCVCVCVSIQVLELVLESLIMFPDQVSTFAFLSLIIGAKASHTRTGPWPAACCVFSIRASSYVSASAPGNSSTSWNVPKRTPLLNARFSFRWSMTCCWQIPCTS